MQQFAEATAPNPGGDTISKVTQFFTQQPQLMVAGQIGLTPLTAAQRRERLAGVNMYNALETVARLQGRWDVAYTTTRRVDRVEGDFLDAAGSGGVCERALNRMIIYGDRLLSPRATAQLQREIIESADAASTAQPVDLDMLVHMLMSITSEQDMSPEFAGDVPTAEEVARLQRKLPTMGLEETHDYAKPLIQNEIASSLFNQPLKLEIVLSNTDDLWFTTWAPRSNVSGLGATPAEAFAIATGVDLLDVMRLGYRIIQRSTATGQVRFTRDELLADGATEAAVDRLFATMARPLADYRAELQGDRDKGEIGNQRYTLTRFPFLAIDHHAVVMLRHQWALDRLCGGQLYFEAWASLSSGALRNRFKTAMSDAFEVFAGRILHRIVDKCPHLRTIVDEPEMQAAWIENKGQTPSVCDWMIFGHRHCIVIDATNHAVKEDAAQGLASWDDYSADVEAIFTDVDHGKFGQLLSTIDQVRKHGGWASEKVDTSTMYAPLIVVPDAGVVNGLLTQFDFNMRGSKAFGHLQPQVYAPGVVPISDIQLLEGFADIGRKSSKSPDMMDLIAKWRIGASKYGLASLQLFLLSHGMPILPISEHILTNSRRVIQRLRTS